MGCGCPMSVARDCFLFVEGSPWFRWRPGDSWKKWWWLVGKAALAQAGRDRARDARLEVARERRLRLDPDQLAREQRIDEAAVDAELAWEKRARAEQAVTDAEGAAAVAVERLLAERLTVHDVVQLTRLDRATVRRLRQYDSEDGRGRATSANTAAAEGAGDEVP